MHTSTKSITFALLLSISLPHFAISTPLPPSSPASCGSCLLPTELSQISQRWLNIFASNGLSDRSSISNAATENVQYWNEEFTFPTSPTPYAVGRAALEGVIAGSVKGSTACRDIVFEIVSVWSSCDRIAVRWRQRCEASGESEKAKAKKGTAVVFSGIDLLTIDLSSRKVSNAETSSDRINYYAGLQLDPFA